MRLQHVWIEEFKNLKDFALDFGDVPLSVLVGRNGAGKSNFLEALTIVFRDLDLRADPSLRYKLSYWCRDVNVEVDGDPSREKDRTRLTADGKAVRMRDYSKYLPNNVFGYYSGPSNRMEGHFEDHHLRFYRALLRGENPSRPLFFARPAHSQFVLLSFFTEEDKVVESFLREELRIEGFESVIFELRRPSWGRTGSGDQRFWGARGTVQDFLDKLDRIAEAHTTPPSMGQKSPPVLYLELPDQASLQRLSAEYPSQAALFNALESTFVSDLIDELKIRVRVAGSTATLTYKELSEGEQQLLSVLGLLRFTRQEESLLLLDEPDTHLNPAWSIKYRMFLETVGGAFANSHTVMATHDPMVVADLEREEVRLFERLDDGRIVAGPPDHEPRGLGVAGLLTTEVYGLRSLLGPHTDELLRNQQRLAVQSSLNDEEKEELSEINEKISRLGFQDVNRDPFIEDFNRAMSAWRAKNQADVLVRSPEQERQMRRAAGEILADLINRRARESGAD